MNFTSARGRWLTFLFSSLPALMARGDEVVSVRVSPKVCYEGCDIRVTVRIEPDPRNRVLAIDADSLAYFRGSAIQLGGESAPVLHTLTLRSPPSGHYVVRATVARADGSTVWSKTQLVVLGTFAEPTT